MPTRILADYHHTDLFESLRILFEDRLGWELYRPLGIEWYHEGYWNLQPFEATAKQYLAVENFLLPDDPDGVPLNTPDGPPRDGVHMIIDGYYVQRRHRAIRLEAAKAIQFDIVLSSVDTHAGIFDKFRDLYCPRAKRIHQQGNHAPAPHGTLNYLNSSLYPAPQVPNHVHYHQEFSLTEFTTQPPSDPRAISSFLHLNYLHYEPQYLQLCELLPGWTCKNHGVGGKDGPSSNMAQSFQQTGFVWHAKKGGDGYGYNVFQAFATGRPILTYRHDYVGKTADRLFTDGQTMIDLDKYSLPEVARQLQAAADDWPAWQSRVLQRFREVVDFDAEFGQIQQFLSRLL